MTTTLSPTSSFTVHHHSNHRNLLLNQRVNFTRIRCIKEGDKSTSRDSSITEPENLMLKTAWYGSELLGIAASFFRSPVEKENDRSIEAGEDGVIERQVIVETIKGDFEKSYFVTGKVTVGAYEDDCEFADPAGSFKGVGRFKRNCTNFGYLIEKSRMKLMKWEEFEDKGIGHWRFSCTMAFPWKPILSATGYTEYYLSKESGKVCRHVEHWNVPKMALFKQLLKPSRS
ncbi:hypothetical protein SSX86_020014 [Deinandra increscens subsp. villosa]|uniref:Uncharacterized protein n=1 Tax=Deinandra increscens subsp. villosa TaxID=3103831 RepID=A0AAP0CTW1_9ASTR